MSLNTGIGMYSFMLPKPRIDLFDFPFVFWLHDIRWLSFCLPLWILSFLAIASGEQLVNVSEPSAFRVCPYLHLPDLLLPWKSICEPSEESVILDKVPQSANAVTASSSRVLELNETTLEQALALVRSRDATFMMILFYAEWCPFSKDVRPIYDALSSLFPSIYHLAVEGTTLKPSVLSKHGIHSFPSIFLHDKVSRNRYRGSRELKQLIVFLENATGLKPLPKGKVAGRVISGLSDFVKKTNENKELCPFPRGLSSRKWLQEDTYLMLATWFLLLRILVPALPWAFTKVKHFWNRCHMYIFTRLRFLIMCRKETSPGTRTNEVTELNSRDIATRWSKSLFS